MKELLLPEPSGSSGAPVCCCLPAQAPCQTLAGSAPAAPALSPETALLTTAHELFAHHFTSSPRNPAWPFHTPVPISRGGGHCRGLGLSYGQGSTDQMSPWQLTLSFTLLLTENSSFFSFSVISPEIFRASFKFSYSLQRDPKSHTVRKAAEPELLRDKPSLVPQIEALDLQSHQRKPRRHNVL